MKSLIKEYRLHFRDRNFLMAVIGAFILLVLSLVVNFYAGTYATEKASNAVTDIILSNIRPFDMDGIFVYGPVIFFIIIGFYCILKPRKIPFTLKSAALFVIIRSLFITLTHIGPFPYQIPLDPGLIGKFVAGPGGDLFFSSHTGLPFLMALVFWKEKYIRFISLLASFVFGAAALLGHYHYSIDVLSAFFITYTIFHMALKLFAKDRTFFLNA